MLLTVGTAAKYQSSPGLDFVATAVKMLEQCDNAYLVAVGPRDEGSWKAAREALGARFLALGPQPDSMPFCRAADVYLEGFPLGSVTAFLEAGLAGLPCVRGPVECAPYTTDDLSVDAFAPPRDVSEYIQMAVDLVKSPVARMEQGLRLQEAIRSDHCGAGWLSRLQAVKSRIPKSHSVYPDFQPTMVDQKVRDWYLRFLFANDPAPTARTLALPLFVEAWRRTDSTPQMDPTLWAELEACAASDRRAVGLFAKVSDRVSLWRLNRTIRSRGVRARLISRGRLALATGKVKAARKLSYECLLKSPPSLWDLNWIKLFVKAHSGKGLVVSLKNGLQWVTGVQSKRVLKGA
jgi:hypothetical protein